MSLNVAPFEADRDCELVQCAGECAMDLEQFDPDMASDTLPEEVGVLDLRPHVNDESDDDLPSDADLPPGLVESSDDEDALPDDVATPRRKKRSPAAMELQSLPKK